MSNKKQICRTDLIQRILALDIQPGSVLDETLLSERYDLSRTPLREVFQKLAGEGYLTIEENRGAKVSSMELDSMRKFFQAAPMIYAAVAKLAAENASDVQLKALKSAQSSFKLSEKANEPIAMAMTNHEFHRIIGEMAGNSFLSPSLNRLLIDHTRMSQKFYKPDDDAESDLIKVASHHHDEMIAAIENRNPEQMVQLTLDHWALSRHQIERFVQPDPLDIGLDIGKSKESKRHAV